MTWLSYLRLFRPVNLVVLVLTQTTVYLTLPERGCWAFAFDARFVMLLLSTLGLAAAGYVINDYYDAKIDLINKPDKTLLDTRISRRYAIILHILLNLMAVGVGFVLSPALGVFNAGVAGILHFYSSKLKHIFFIGNLVVAALLGLVVFVVWLFDRGLNFELVLFYSVFAGLIGLLREIVKDVEDREGDSLFGSRTIPLQLGVHGAKRVIKLLTAVFLAFLGAYVIAVYFYLNIWISLYLVVLVAGPTLFFMNQLQQADTKAKFHQLSQWLKGIMVTGLLSLFLVCI
jgi:4-hydroxybenzoate polyprenyltransferase